MFFKRQKGKYHEVERVTRFKLIKSGKHWLRAATSQFGLFINEGGRPFINRAQGNGRTSYR